MPQAYKLTERQRLDIVRLRRGGSTTAELMERFGVTKKAIQYIIRTRGQK